MKERGEERILVPMKLSGLGSTQSAPETMVILLTPVEQDKYHLPSGEQMIYPIGVPPEMAPIYFARITHHFMPDGDMPQLTHFYELMSETKLQTLNIYQGKLGARPYLVFRDKEGEENSFRVSLPNGILSAISHNLPILMELKLLEAAASVVKVNRGEPGKVSTEKEDSVTSLEAINNEIKSGNKPEYPQSVHLMKAISRLTVEDRAKLIELAVEEENYEWAAVLKDLKIGDE